MEIRTLKYFLATSQEGSLTKAANVLHVTQPTLSRQIKELEEELGVTLFNRHSHGLSLTRDGFLLRKRAEEMLEMLEKTKAEFAAANQNISGDVHIGCGETKAMRLVAEVIQETIGKYPDVHFHLFSGNSYAVTERLDKGLLDFGILIQPADLTRYDYLNLPKKDTWGVLTRKDSKLAALSAVTLQDLQGMPLFLSRQPIALDLDENEFLAWFGMDLKKLHIIGTYNLIYNAAIMVEQGFCHAVVLDGLADVSENSPLCFRPLQPPLEAELNFVWKKYQIFSPAAELFLREIQNKFGLI